MDPKDKAGFNFKQFMAKIGKETSETDKVTEPTKEIKGKGELYRKYKALENDYKELKEKIDLITKDFKDLENGKEVYKLVKFFKDCCKLIENIPDLESVEKSIISSCVTDMYNWVQGWNDYFKKYDIPIDGVDYLVSENGYLSPDKNLSIEKSQYRTYSENYDRLKSEGKIKNQEKMTEFEYIYYFAESQRKGNKLSKFYDPDFDWWDFEGKKIVKTERPDLTDKEISEQYDFITTKNGGHIFSKRDT